jgi:hypothetical protein
MRISYLVHGFVKYVVMPLIVVCGLLRPIYILARLTNFVVAWNLTQQFDVLYNLLTTIVSTPYEAIIRSDKLQKEIPIDFKINWIENWLFTAGLRKVTQRDCAECSCQ